MGKYAWEGQGEIRYALEFSVVVKNDFADAPIYFFEIKLVSYRE